MSDVVGKFRIDAWDPNGRAVDVGTGTPLAGAFIHRTIEGETLAGTSQVLFAGAFNDALASGTYVAIDAFEGVIDGRAGTCNFWHTSTMERGVITTTHAMLQIVPDSGTGQLTGIRGTGEFTTVDGDEAIRLRVEFTDPDDVIDGDAAVGRLER